MNAHAGQEMRVKSALPVVPDMPVARLTRSRSEAQASALVHLEAEIAYACGYALNEGTED
jgi:hypothetical protein